MWTGGGKETSSRREGKEDGGDIKINREMNPAPWTICPNTVWELPDMGGRSVDAMPNNVYMVDQKHMVYSIRFPWKEDQSLNGSR